MNKRCLNAEEAAAYIGRSKWKLRNLTQAGKIPYIPGDGPTAPWLWDINDLDKYIEESKIVFPQF
jgi:helix-turn-helix protein